MSQFAGMTAALEFENKAALSSELGWSIMVLINALYDNFCARETCLLLVQTVHKIAQSNRKKNKEYSEASCAASTISSLFSFSTSIVFWKRILFSNWGKLQQLGHYL
jgi:hypothetical protein